MTALRASAAFYMSMVAVLVATVAVAARPQVVEVEVPTVPQACVAALDYGDMAVRESARSIRAAHTIVTATVEIQQAGGTVAAVDERRDDLDYAAATVSEAVGLVDWDGWDVVAARCRGAAE